MEGTIFRARWTLHARGIWSARTDRAASVVWLTILWLGMIVGFALDFPRYIHQKPLPAILHVHAVVYTAWLVIMTAQVLLVVANRVRWHRQLGWFAAGWAGLMAVVGPLAAFEHFALKLDRGDLDCSFLIINLVDTVAFLVLLAWGLWLRRDPAAHRRMMMLSLVALADPGFSRVSDYLFIEPGSPGPWFLYNFYGNALVTVLMLAWDVWRGRLVRPFLVAACGLLVAFAVASWLNFWTPWREVALAWVQAYVHTWRA